MSDNELDFDYSKFGENMKKRRIEKKFSQDTLAEMINHCRRWVIDVEAGKSAPTLEDAISICNALDCDMAYLFGRRKSARAIYQAIGEYMGLSENAARAMCMLKNTPIISTLIESLFTQEQTNDITGKKELVPSNILLDLRDLCTADYGPNNAIGYYQFNDVYSGMKNTNISPCDIFRIDEQRLYDDLRQYIKQQRKKDGLPIYDLIDEV